MKKINQVVEKKYTELDERIIQFGEGNFLRAFTDWMVDIANDERRNIGRVCLVQPIKDGLADILNEQDCLYTVHMRGQVEGKKIAESKIIHSVSRCLNPYSDFMEYIKLAESEKLEVVISNTTEAGITYKKELYKENQIADSFPAKITQLLYRRYKKFVGDKEKGLLFLPVELIDDNGYYLKKYVIQHAIDWNLEQEFIDWINNCNEFTSTLVDRIVTGRPNDTEKKELFEKLGYEDNLIVTSEVFNLWVIQGNLKWKEKFNLDGLPCNAIWVDDVTPYKKRKVRILNGAHTSTITSAIVGGHKIVRDFMEDKRYLTYLDNLLGKEVIPTIDLSKVELEDFKNQVYDRFNNPFIDHRLLDISLNSISKWNARCLPSAYDYYINTKDIPNHFAFSLASLIRLYKVQENEGQFFGITDNNEKYQIKDDVEILNMFAKYSNDDDYIERILELDLWDDKLNQIPEFKILVKKYYDEIISIGINASLDKLNKKGE